MVEALSAAVAGDGAWSGADDTMTGLSSATGILPSSVMLCGIDCYIDIDTLPLAGRQFQRIRVAERLAALRSAGER